MESILSIQEIKKIIPHRYPFLLLDKIVQLERNKKIVACKNVTINEDFFNGHFPDKPVMPGVLMIEAMAQAGVVLAKKSVDDIANNKIIYFMSIEKAHFRKTVEPGDTLYIHVEQVQARRNVWKMRGEVKVEGTKVADTVFSAMLTNN